MNLEDALKRADHVESIVKEFQFTPSINEDAIMRLAAEVRRLQECLKVANSNHERFEREWYLRGDEIERLQSEVAVLRGLLRECYGDYSHPRFTDRHGMAGRIKVALESGAPTPLLEGK